MGNNLTWKAIEQAYEMFSSQLETLLYATSDQIERGKIIYIGPKWCPEYIVFHPLDFDMICGLANDNGYRLLEIKNYLDT